MFEVFFMNEKIDNTLNIALNLPEEDLEKSQELSVGIENDIWELIIRYQGNLDELRRLPNVNVRELSNGYAVITTPKNLIDAISNLEQIIFIEKPKRLEYSVLNGKRESCINQVQQENFLNNEKALLLALLTVESITPIRFLEIRTEVREF
jgi:minor extracellular serine protease Vpr